VMDTMLKGEVTLVLTNHNEQGGKLSLVIRSTLFNENMIYNTLYMYM